MIPKIFNVNNLPYVATGMIEAGTLGHIYRMFIVRSSLGQNFWSWIILHIALWLWMIYYVNVLPHAKSAKIVTGISLFNTALIACVTWYFQYNK